MNTNVLKRIFIDHWKPFVEKYGKRIRPSVLKEVEKFLNCGDPKKGFKLLVLRSGFSYHRRYKKRGETGWST
nr:transposase zinc-binding domain-containing protein [Brevibacillus ruminantium]